MTKPISRQMLIDCLLYRLGMPVCGECKELIRPRQKVEFDHIHADVFDGPHEYQNLRPLHAECHKKKTKRDVQANAKVKRIIKKKTGNEKPKRKIASRPWPKASFSNRAAKAKS